MSSHRDDTLGYDSVNDPYCPYTKSAKFKRHMQRMRRAEAAAQGAAIRSRSQGNLHGEEAHAQRLGAIDNSMRPMAGTSISMDGGAPGRGGGARASRGASAATAAVRPQRARRGVPGGDRGRRAR